jgi:hypothetical protein
MFNGRTRPNRRWSYVAKAPLSPRSGVCEAQSFNPANRTWASVSVSGVFGSFDELGEHLTWRVYHAQSRFNLRCVPHADSGQPRGAGLEPAGFRVRLSLSAFGRLASRDPLATASIVHSHESTAFVELLISLAPCDRAAFAGFDQPAKLFNDAASPAGPAS